MPLRWPCGAADSSNPIPWSAPSSWMPKAAWSAKAGIRSSARHAEVHALNQAGEFARGVPSSSLLSLAVIRARRRPAPMPYFVPASRTVVAMADPFPQVAGGGIAILRNAGIDVEVGVCEVEAKKINAPYLKLLRTGRPWVHLKWAMSLDGKIATRTGNRSGSPARSRVAMRTNCGGVVSMPSSSAAARWSPTIHG